MLNVGTYYSYDGHYFYADRYLHPSELGAMVLGHALADRIKENIL